MQNCAGPAATTLACGHKPQLRCVPGVQSATTPGINKGFSLCAWCLSDDTALCVSRLADVFVLWVYWGSAGNKVQSQGGRFPPGEQTCDCLPAPYQGSGLLRSSVAVETDYVVPFSDFQENSGTMACGLFHRGPVCLSPCACVMMLTPSGCVIHVCFLLDPLTE